MASFRNIYTSLMLVIARSTEKELARQVSYLKAENQILRSRLPDKISLTEREKNRLVRGKTQPLSILERFVDGFGNLGPKKLHAQKQRWGGLARLKTSRN
jgi:hypothetical protein